MRRRSSSATVERLIDTCGMARAAGRVASTSGSAGGSGAASDCPAAVLAFRLWYSHNSKIPNMILWLCRRWKILLRLRSPLLNRAASWRSTSAPAHWPSGERRTGFYRAGPADLRRSNKRNDLDHLRRVIRQYGISELVMGLPLRMSGARASSRRKFRSSPKNCGASSSCRSTSSTSA